MKRTVGAILFVIYAIIAVTVTVLLLSFNSYNCSEIGGYTIYIVKNDALEPEYKQGSILLIKDTDDKHVQVGDSAFFYKVINSQEFEFVQRTLKNKSQQGRHIVYNVSEEETYDSTYFIGKTEDTIVIEGPWGTILSILESKWGYLFCIVVVSLLLFLQEVFDLVIEIKYGKTNKENAEAQVETEEQPEEKLETKPKAEPKAKIKIAASEQVPKKIQPETKVETSTEVKKQPKTKTRTATSAQAKEQPKAKAEASTPAKEQPKAKAETSTQAKKQPKTKNETKAETKATTTTQSKTKTRTATSTHAKKQPKEEKEEK